MTLPSQTPDRRAKLEQLARLSAAVAASAVLAPTSAHATTECQPWSATIAYVAGDTVTENGRTYQANWWTQGNNPATNNGGSGSGQPWTLAASCSATPAPPPTPTPAPPPPAPTPPSPAPSGPCAAWNSTTAYSAGATVTENGVTYAANWWTQGDDPATHNGPTGSGQPWTVTTSCSSGSPTPPPPPPPAPIPPSPPPAPALAGFVFGSYKDVTINMDWNDDQISTAVTGSRQPVLSVLPARQKTVSWAFASGECGSENWGGVAPAALVAQNVSQWVSAGVSYIVSTGGADGVFTCGSDANFETFIQTYDSARLLGIDFDIEGGQSQDVIDNLVARVKVAQVNHPNLRFSFTLATLGGNSPQSLGAIGVNVMSAIQAAGLSNYIINLMTMDYGSATASNCTLGGNGQCDMGQSAINAAINLHSYYGVPYSQIEITPMIGGNDTSGEVFTLADVDTVSSWALANHLAGLHFWSLDRDTDCAPGSASATCNSVGSAGNFGFANRFIADLGL